MKTRVSDNSTDSELAAGADQKSLENGCPDGSGAGEPPSVVRCGTRPDSEMTVEFRWQGHWEVWEMEWGGPRWVWDDACPGEGVSSRER